MLAPYSMESVALKSSSGTWRSESLCPSSWRMYPAADFSPRHRGLGPLQALHGAHIYGAVGQVVGDLHPHDAQKAVLHPGVLHLPENGGKLPLHIFRNPSQLVSRHLAASFLFPCPDCSPSAPSPRESSHGYAMSGGVVPKKAPENSFPCSFLKGGQAPLCIPPQGGRIPLANPSTRRGSGLGSRLGRSWTVPTGHQDPPRTPQGHALPWLTAKGFQRGMKSPL